MKLSWPVQRQALALDDLKKEIELSKDAHVLLTMFGAEYNADNRRRLWDTWSRDERATAEKWVCSSWGALTVIDFAAPLTLWRRATVAVLKHRQKAGTA